MNASHTPFERGLAVLQAFSADNPTLSATEVSTQTGIPYSAVYRCLYTLSKMGFVQRQAKGYFSVTAKVLALSQAYRKDLHRPTPISY
ncbi:helix-turn-helix domain-containing protein [Pseudogulbenkiania subflava]|uniref:IclR helix-turn-helix domain-containing protein n=1 Tax=Pseudogulbenkiania subflava DSM 22618 TaxID=1123014 RepID=A0A1Y6CA45_9NEIS|nr:helix-turn-helix domain-containing protein [Pseudogulbenkiania subflava]SMF42661.1 IclR helix-turn-helix domain-containing protein [Pseudogulbenkiania subflava DSM 22618]